jgi:hypothetical protein
MEKLPRGQTLLIVVKGSWNGWELEAIRTLGQEIAKEYKEFNIAVGVISSQALRQFEKARAGAASAARRGMTAIGPMLTFLGSMLIVLGAHAEAKKTFDRDVRWGSPTWAASWGYAATFLPAVGAGVLDDAMMGLGVVNPAAAAVYMDRYEGFVGPLQQEVGKFVREPPWR